MYAGVECASSYDLGTACSRKALPGRDRRLHRPSALFSSHAPPRRSNRALVRLTYLTASVLCIGSRLPCHRRNGGLHRPAPCSCLWRADSAALPNVAARTAGLTLADLPNGCEWASSVVLTRMNCSPRSPSTLVRRPVAMHPYLELAQGLLAPGVRFIKRQCSYGCRSVETSCDYNARILDVPVFPADTLFVAGCSKCVWWDCTV